MQSVDPCWRAVIAISLMAIAAACLGTAAREIAFGQPQLAANVALEIDPPTLRVVDSPPSQVHSLSFAVTNSMGKAIELDSRSTTCGCTIANHGQSRIAPGGTATVNVKWIAPDQTGIYESKVLVRWRSEKQTGTSVVTISGNVASAEPKNEELKPAL